MKADKNKFATLVASSLVISLLAVAGCGKADMSATAPPPAATIPPPPTPYTPPTAEQLSQLVAPIALFPDQLIAQILAGSTYPDQITAANQWLRQNSSLKGEALQNAANLQAWDVSVKSLTAFTAVLAQMANNIQWTTALGEAYANDPNDVMNAIQAMRLRAQQSGNLKTSPQMRVTSSSRPAPPPDYTDDSTYSVIPPPSQTIVIESAQPDMVYVPHYNPALVYGAPIPVYPNYAYNSGYSSGDMITTGIISFGLGILVGNAINHHDGWGWHSWGMNWGGRGLGPDHGGNHGWHRPAVTYNDSIYVPRSTTIINRNNNAHITNNFGALTNSAPAINNHAGRPKVSGGTPDFRPQGQNLNTPPQNKPMTMPRFKAGDTHPGARSSMNQADTQRGMNTPHPAPSQNGAMTMPRFNSGDTHAGSRPAMNGSDTQHNANIPRPTQAHPAPAREAQRRKMPAAVNNRSTETRPLSETGQRLHSNGLQHQTGQSTSTNTISTESRSQNPMHAAPSQNTLRSTSRQQNEMRQQRMERENMPLRSNQEPIPARPQAQPQPHPPTYSAPAPQQPRFERPPQQRVQAPRFEQPQVAPPQQPRFEPTRPQAQRARLQQQEQARPSPAKKREEEKTDNER